MASLNQSSPPVVLVTGLTGLLGTAIGLELARAGFPLRGTTRSQERATQWSAKYPNVAVDWMVVHDHKFNESGTYDDAVRGCGAVMHVAGPYTLNHKTGEEIMTAQTKGMQSILDACAKEPMVKRLVYTGTVAAINDDPHLGTGLGKVYTEKDWNPTTWEKGATATGQHMAVTSYCAGKTLCERLAWKFMEEHAPTFDLVVLCPGTVYGQPMQVLRSLQDLDAASSRLWSHITHAKETIPGDPSPVFSNILDVAEAHLKALTWPICKNSRYMIVSGSYSYARILAILRKRFPDQAHRFPIIENEGLPLKPVFINDCSKAERELGMRWRSLEETVVEAAKVLFRLESEAKH